MRQLWAMLAPHWRIGLWALLATIGATLAELVIPLLSGNIVDIAVSQQGIYVFPQMSPLASAVTILIVTALARWGFQFLRRYTAGRLAIETQHSLRIQLLHTVLHLDGPTQDRLRTGQVISRSISDIQSIQGLVAMLPLTIGNLLQLIVTAIMMLYLSPLLALAGLIWLPVIAWLAGRSKAPVTSATKAAQQQASDLATHIEETITGIRIVQGFAQEEREENTIAKSSASVYHARIFAAKVTAKFQPLLEQLPQAALVCTILLGGWMATQNMVSVGIFVTFSMYVSRLTGTVRMLGNMAVRIQSGLASVERVHEISSLELATDHGDTNIPQGPLTLEFHHVDFQSKLCGFNLTIPAGSTVVAVGPPAGGKTLAVQLAARFYDPDQGEIRIQGIPLPEIPRAQLRDSLAVVFDEPFLFEASVRQNLTLGETISEDEIWRVLRITQAQNFITELPQGLDTIIGERGVTLSGGQRQRLALARALLRQPRILLLDDATSAIDAETESRIFQELENEFTDMTVFAITHRTSMVRLADYIAIIEDGAVTNLEHRDAFTNSAEFQKFIGTETLNTYEYSTAELELETDFNSKQKPVNDDKNTRQIGASPQPVEISKPFSLAFILRQVSLPVVALICLLLGGVATDLALPTLVRYTVDSGITQGNSSIFILVAVTGFAIVLAAWGMSVIRTQLATRIGERLLYSLRVKSYGHLVRLDLAYFERTRTGSILTRMTTDIDNLSSFLQLGVAQAIVASTTLVGIAGMLLITSPKLALAAFAAIPIVVIATVTFRRVTAPLYTRAREELSTINAEFHESFSGIRTIQMHNAEQELLQRFTASCNAYRYTRFRSQLAVAMFFPGINAIAQITRATVLGIGASMVLHGNISPGVLVAFLLYMGLLFDPIQELSQLYDAYQQAKVSLQRISELLNEKPKVHSTGNEPGAVNAIQGQIQLDSVTFSYTHADVLEDIDLTIKPGSTVALVGHTGAGKSTLIKLLARFYDPSSGIIRASGTNIAQFPLDQWRRSIGIVPQEPHLFTGTIAENIAYGNPTASSEEIIAAARRVGALAIIAKIPDGLNFHIGERGRGLSSGQRQLIALARAELTYPKLVLFDEATATLDPATEKIVLDASQKFTMQRTSIIVAHRLATAARADRILVLKHGRIIEDGTHQELLAYNGTYAHMWGVGR